MSRFVSITDIKPQCHRCKKAVDRVEKMNDFRSRIIHFAVFCHGEMEHFCIDPDVIETITGIGYAFLPKEIACQKSLSQKPLMLAP